MSKKDEKMEKNTTEKKDKKKIIPRKQKYKGAY